MVKLKLIILTICFTGILMACKHQLKTTTATVVENKTHNGPISQGQIIDIEYKVTNTGKEKLVISDIQTTCGCISIDYKKETIPPGKSSLLNFKFDTSLNKGQVEYEIFLYGNFDSTFVYRLSFEANIIDKNTSD